MGSALFEKMKSRLEQAIEKTSHPKAAFDADGTLWPTDVGRDFFHYQIKKALLRKKYACPQTEFDQIKEKQGMRASLIWLASSLAGFPIVQVRSWVLDFLADNPLKPFLFQRQLIDWLHEKNVSVFVVSSSLKWVLDSAVQVYGIPKERVIGVETVIKDQIITDHLVSPPPIQAEKVKALQSQAEGGELIFSAGNTLSDQKLLEESKGISFVVATAKNGQRNYDSERNLLQLAKQKSWFYQDGSSYVF